MDNLDNLKTVKLAELAFAAQSFVNAAVDLDIVPQFERDTWTQQAAEAKAWAADNNAPTPILDIISKRTGDKREALIKKALKKTQIYTPIAADVSGQRQVYARQISLAANEEDLEQIVFVFTLPELS